MTPVVEKALTALTRRVNLATGLGHPSDRPSAIYLFKMPRQGQKPFELAEIKQKLLSLGWNDEGAEGGRFAGERVLAGRSFLNWKVSVQRWIPPR